MPAAAPIVALFGAAVGMYAGGAAGALIVIGASVVAGGIAYATRKDYDTDSGAAAGGLSPMNSGHQITTTSSRRPLPVPYGVCKLGVNQTFKHAANPYLHLICEISEGPISGIVREDDSLYNTTATQLPTSNPPMVYFDDRLFSEWSSDLVYIEFFDGASNQSVCSTLNSVTANWDQPLRYTAYLYVRLKYDRDEFKSVPDVRVKIEGLEIYDPVTTSTAYTNNPAICTYNYMTRSSQRGGMGIAAAAINTTSVSDAKDYCATKGWTANMPVIERQACADNLRQILSNFRGDVIYTDSEIKIKFYDLNHESNVMALTDADVVSGTLAISQPSAMARPNAVRITYLSEDKQYKADDFVKTDKTAFDAEGDYRETNIICYGLTDQQLVQSMANYHLERLRWNKSVKFTAGSRAMALEPMDLITLTHDVPGWSAKQLRVLGGAVHPDHTVSLECIEEQTSLYDDTYNLTSHAWHDTTLPNPMELPPSVISVSHSETVYYYRGRSFTRWEIDFSAPADTTYPFWSHAEIWLKVGSGGTWRYMTTSQGNYQLDPVEEGELYYVRMRSVSVFGAKEVLASASTVSSTITGKTAAPTSLTSLTAIANANAVNLFSAKVSDPDIELYEFRLGSSWTGAILLAALRSPNLSLSGVKPSGSGGHTFYCSTLSNNGTYGATPRSANVVIKDPPDGWTVQNTETCDYDGIGTHDNTEHTTYDSDDYLKCSHTGAVLTGTYTSPEYDRGASARYMVYCLADIVVTGAGTTWGDVIPASNTWDSINITTRTWTEIFELSAGPQGTMKLKYGETSPPSNEVEKMEIVSAIVTGRYFQMEITITDPSSEVNALVNDFVLKFLQS